MRQTFRNTNKPESETNIIKKQKNNQRFILEIIAVNRLIIYLLIPLSFHVCVDQTISTLFN